ncbi:hypothetical protein MHLP_01105 [Candidatus Mycoplasma haematolamae str. Purdue]|uniref:Uncharacterized protein n=1 Tax=Mycoplasma haematolamae (strain Purdue) TaxID=1212765 RepID=I7CEW4_MYCHA|nr:hypothetical protein [Candidatus Mycoplasma haematolamae]AFO51801.1 hypothetical protein MHLP_01105 [Candidatus Mycoplasma haematolamae str. Purdue]
MLQEALIAGGGTRQLPKEEVKDLEYWGKEVHYQMKLKKGSVLMGSPLYCKPESEGYAYFFFREQQGSKKIEIVCNYWSEKKDISLIQDTFDGNTITVKCNKEGDAGEVRNYTCHITAQKDMSIGGTGKGDKVTLS